MARPAILRIPTVRVDDEGHTIYDVHTESVLIHMSYPGERALCEHPDGTVTLENWGHVKFLDSDERFGRYDWGE